MDHINFSVTARFWPVTLFWLGIIFCFGPGNCFATSCCPLNTVVGNVVSVENVSELYSAVNQINSSGGNGTILLADGQYHLSQMLFVTAGNVVIRSESGIRENVVLTGNGMTGSISHVFLIRGANVTIADISFGEIANHAVQVQGEFGVHDVLIHNVHIFNTGEQMIKGTFNSTSGLTSSDSVVECSLLEYTDAFGPQYYIGGIDVHHGENWSVRDNTFRNIRSPDAALAEHAIHFWSDSQETLVERNLIVNCDRGIGFGLGSSGHQGGIIRNNMIANNGLGLHDDVGIGLENAPHAKVYHNTIYMTSGYPNAIEYRFAGSIGVEIYNNLTNGVIARRNGASADVRGNVINARGSWFVDSSRDLHLAGDVPEVIDQGMVVEEVVDDFDSMPRPIGGASDIGADEFTRFTADSDGDNDVDGVDLAAYAVQCLLDPDNPALADLAGQFSM